VLTEGVQPPASLLITGTVGAGKTTVAEAVGDLLAARGAPHAVVDLDQLSRCWPPPAGDRFNHAIELRNLRSVTANYRAAGVLRLILAGVIEQRSHLLDYERALDCRISIVRLRADPHVLADRLRDRHRNDPDGLAWHLARAPELTAVLDLACVADAEVDTTGRPIPEVAADVLDAVGW